MSALEGEQFDGLINLIGEKEATYRKENSRLKKKAINDGFLRPTHFVGFKPRG